MDLNKYGSKYLYDRITPGSTVIGVNLVANPRNCVGDAVRRSLSGIDTTASLAFTQVAKFTHNIEQYKKLVYNKPDDSDKLPTKTPYPYGMMKSYFINTSINPIQLETEFLAFVKTEQMKIRVRLEELLKYLETDFTKRNGDEFLTRKKVIDDMPDSSTKTALMNALLVEITAQDAIDEPRIKELLNNAKQILDNIISKKQKVLDSLSNIRAKKIIINDLTSSDGIKLITQEKAQIIAYNALVQDEYYAHLIYEQYAYSYTGLLNLKDIFIQSSDPSKFETNDDGTTKLYKGIIQRLKDDIHLHKEFIDAKKDIKLIAVNLINDPLHCKHTLLVQRKYGIAGLWGCDLYPYIIKTDLSTAGTEINKEKPDQCRVYWNENKRYVADTAETATVFVDTISQIYDKEFIAVFRIKKPKRPRHARRITGEAYYTTDAAYDKDYYYDIYYTTEQSKVLQALISVNEIEQSKLFHPTLQIMNNGVQWNTDYNEELLRNLYIDIVGMNKYIAELCNITYELKMTDVNIMTYINNIGLIRSTDLPVNKMVDCSTTRLIEYYKTHSNKTIKSGTIRHMLSDVIRDIYFVHGISINNKHSVACQYLYEFFKYLSSISTITKQKYTDYIASQSKTGTISYSPSLFKNKFIIRNKLMEFVFEYSYITSEILDNTWVTVDSDYLNGVKHEHYPSFCMCKIVNGVTKQISHVQYSQTNYPTLTDGADFYGLPVIGLKWLVSDSNEITSDGSILEIYYQINNYQYEKLSIVGLKQTIKRRPGFLTLPEDEHLAEMGAYVDKQFTAYDRRLVTHTNELKLTPTIIDDPNQKVTVNKVIVDELGTEQLLPITPTINNNLSAFLVPIWDHKLDDPKYYDVSSYYTMNVVETIYHNCLNLLIFADLSEIQRDPLSDDKYWIPVEKRDYVLKSYLDNFISKYSLDQKTVLYEYQYSPYNDYPVDEQYKELMYHIGTAPNVTAYLPIPPDPFASRYMTAMHRVSINLSGQLSNNTTQFYFEERSLENQVFGKIEETMYNKTK